MKMIYCTCNVSVLNELINIFEECKIKNYQITKEVVGKSVFGEPRMNTAVWPGHNSTLISQVDDNNVEKIVSKIKKFNEEAYNDNENITLSAWKIDDYID
jgi:hypothetical protein